MKLYGIKSCASVKKARSFFDTNDIKYEFIDISKKGIDSDKLNYWTNFIDSINMLNPRSKAYKENKVKEMKNLTSKKASKLILNDNTILKRPIIEHGLNGEEKLYIGFKESDYIKEFLG
jgi:Spx/MgsR family transcriptional regulator